MRWILEHKQKINVKLACCCQYDGQFFQLTCLASLLSFPSRPVAMHCQIPWRHDMYAQGTLCICIDRVINWLIHLGRNKRLSFVEFIHQESERIWHWSALQPKKVVLPSAIFTAQSLHSLFFFFVSLLQLCCLGERVHFQYEYMCRIPRLFKAWVEFGLWENTLKNLGNVFKINQFNISLHSARHLVCVYTESESPLLDHLRVFQISTDKQMGQLNFVDLASAFIFLWIWICTS